MGSVYALGVLLLAYLLGSIPSAVWVGLSFYGIDVREYGSGNAGATNTFRVLGKKPGTIVLILDTLKGWGATNLAYLIGVSITGHAGCNKFVNYQIALGLVAVIGHLFPIFAGFRGGKGVATLMGMILAIHLPASLICIAIFIIVLLSTRHVSLGSIIGGICFPIVIFFLQSPARSLMLFGVAIAALLLITHQKNIERLLKGTESRVNLFRKTEEALPMEEELDNE